MPEVDQQRRVASAERPPSVPWYETTAAIVVAGIGGVAAIVALVVAILMTSHHSVLPHQPERLTPLAPTKPVSSRSTTTSISTAPRTPVSTSEDLGPITVAPPPAQEPDTTTPPTTTMSNPYATTSVPNGAAF
ncbi:MULTISPECIES: hypothetical protein [Mycolicibacterium]|uniref:Uncharacterized protein n=1 Tax=Mycolicibacterium senegalense TaxID=1796 RepID=A0A378T0F0_9MYCO|nr:MULTISPECIES: hypothetical protein [Mycolicibacterium]MCV7339011.1 hypothetical protein [Mycolicibacterium senegalense]MDR7289474.1 hypothetical protein [Mycolicibacterium senegalense]QZA26312.1 hypothetical protein K3U95_09805 [Mycolicibacterium senegalense]CDP88924.1 hypothetical protein BN975_04769 [Mycolicibacterium farcinogenes]STZ53647.1 Uncharacterised protein [Mycolicibacterium senegalense]